MSNTGKRSLILVTATLLAACDPGGGTRSDPLDDASDPRDFFRAVAFGYGPVVERVPEIQERYAIDMLVGEAEAAEIRVAMEEIVDTIEEVDPEFIDEFAAEMRSGDPVRIDAAITRGSDMAREALAVHETLGPLHDAYEQLEQAEQADQAGAHSLKAREAVQNLDGIEHVLAVTTILAVAEYWFLFQFKYIWQYDGSTLDREDDLFRDRLVMSIATNLRESDPVLATP